LETTHMARPARLAVASRDRTKKADNIRKKLIGVSVSKKSVLFHRRLGLDLESSVTDFFGGRWQYLISW